MRGLVAALKIGSISSGVGRTIRHYRHFGVQPELLNGF